MYVCVEKSNFNDRVEGRDIEIIYMSGSKNSSIFDRDGFFNGFLIENEMWNVWFRGSKDIKNNIPAWSFCFFAFELHANFWSPRLNEWKMIVSLKYAH